MDTVLSSRRWLGVSLEFLGDIIEGSENLRLRFNISAACFVTEMVVMVVDPTPVWIMSTELERRSGCFEG